MAPAITAFAGEAAAYDVMKELTTGAVAIPFRNNRRKMSIL
jgi:hypothetical protein